MTGVVVVMAERYGIHIEKAKVVPSMANGFRASHDPSAPRPGALKNARRKKPGRFGRDDRSQKLEVRS
jgi:hypothetical protein